MVAVAMEFGPNLLDTVVNTTCRVKMQSAGSMTFFIDDLLPLPKIYLDGVEKPSDLRTPLVGTRRVLGGAAFNSF